MHAACRLPMAAVAAFAGSPVPHVAHAESTDIFQSAAPVDGSAAPKAGALSSGDVSVSTQTGALDFSVPITLPPGRQGAAPNLALSYSSQGAIYGGLAAGWSMALPSITEDTGRSHLKTRYGLNEARETAAGIDKRNDDRFVSSLAGGRPLERIMERAAPSGGVLQGSYRAQNDPSFARYERLNVSGAAQMYRWRVLTPDGAIAYFGGAVSNGTTEASPCATIISDSYAPLTKTVDPFGNTVTYNYQWDGPNSECRIDNITYGANLAGLGDFARVNFIYDGVQTCSGTTIPIGSQSDYRTGIKMVSGAKRLATIRVARIPMSTGPTSLASTTPITVREVTLTYGMPGYVGGSCPSAFAPYRTLDAIQEHVYPIATQCPDASATLTARQVVRLPATTFEYGTALLDRSVSTSTPTLGWGYRPGRMISAQGAQQQWGSVEEMLVDMNGDGLLDRVRSEPLPAASEGGSPRVSQCQARVIDAVTSAQSLIPLPKLEFDNKNPSNPLLNRGYPENCSLNYQSTRYSQTNVTGTCLSGQGGTVLAYRWLDHNRDGRTDVVASLYHDGCYFPDMEPYDSAGAQQPMPLGLTPLGNNSLTCPVTRPGNDCKPGFGGSWASSVVGTAGQLVSTDWDAYNNVTSGAPPLPGGRDHICGHEDFPMATYNRTSVHPDSQSYNTVPLPTAPQQAYGRCGRYPWFIYPNAISGGITAANQQITWQATPIEGDQGDSALGTNGGGGYSRSEKAVVDFDGDGNLDIVAVGDSYTPELAGWWTINLGNSDGTVDPNTKVLMGANNPTSAYASVRGAITESSNFYVPAGQCNQLSDGSWPVGCSTGESTQVSGLLDFNGDGLLDYYYKQQLSTYAYAPYKVALNSGNGLRMVRPAVATDPLEGEVNLSVGMPHISRTRLAGTVATQPCGSPNPPCVVNGGTRYAMERPIDVDADGRVDIITMGTSELNVPAVYFNVGGQFTGPTTMAGTGIHAPQIMEASGTTKIWTMKADFLDMDGYGIVEYYENGGLQGRKYNPAGKPPRLLHTIHNGRGADTMISYTHMHDVSTVVQDTAFGKVTPVSQWVVKSLTSTDALTPTDNAGGANYSATTTYKYVFPRHLYNEEHYAFRGFEEVTTTAPTGATTISRYDFTADPTGRLVETVVNAAPSDDNGSSRTITATTYVKTQLFNQASPSWDGIVNFFPTTVTTYVCSNGQNEIACKLSPAAFNKVTTEYGIAGATPLAPASDNNYSMIVPIRSR